MDKRCVEAFLERGHVSSMYNLLGLNLVGNVTLKDTGQLFLSRLGGVPATNLIVSTSLEESGAGVLLRSSADDSYVDARAEDVDARLRQVAVDDVEHPVVADLVDGRFHEKLVPRVLHARLVLEPDDAWLGAFCFGSRGCLLRLVLPKQELIVLQRVGQIVRVALSVVSNQRSIT